ncbi:MULTISPECIES: DUF2325 domain-containing protein [Methylosinus]|uniref:DUF2325 domain-containing protein n=1 Tax=Methylosinus trichosporium (strain ATCC 35070 / NCIMB 11131 / UNIQEM 75 / OB3b) TaxID=595536 RepID=A0A2D2D561_METT3|nr:MULTISPECIES: DUF2325 domain-containing protein [Methylosinus]ATQ70094.1 DUF2325 domain-containing protein [Methylosinus trichosporium OB3b]OBS52532.1 hypothetical protein A8B73_10520 [Methylosinus sp. 3S-1]
MSDALQRVSSSVLEKLTQPPRISRGEPGVRRRIWEIIGASHCSIIGTCMTIAELRKIARRTRFLADEQRYNDYHIHGLFVEAMSEDCAVSRAVQKHLDTKYEGAIRKAKSLDGDEAFLAYWESAVDNGFVPGAYWALIGHPRLPIGVDTRIFGDIHMMSHLCGATHRGEAREIAELRREKAEIARRFVALVAERNDEIARQRGEIARLSAAVRELTPLEEECERLRREARRDSRAELDAALRENAVLREDRARLEQRLERLSARRSRIDAPPPAPLPPSPPLEISIAAASEEPMDLCGRCLLYVGGRPRTVGRLQQIVEQHNGSLIHHDGGMEDSRAMLSELVRRADAVFFPVDCVSHRAVDAVKSLCESRGIPYCPLRSASASAFERAITELGRAEVAASS